MSRSFVEIQVFHVLDFCSRSRSLRVEKLDNELQLGHRASGRWPRTKKRSVGAGGLHGKGVVHRNLDGATAP